MEPSCSACAGRRAGGLPGAGLLILSGSDTLLVQALGGRSQRYQLYLPPTDRLVLISTNDGSPSPDMDNLFVKYLTINGQNLHALGEAERGALRNRALGFVYQFHDLLPEFTALENVAMPLLVRRTPVAVARASAAAVLERVGLGARLDHKPGELSGGERQRAAVARALVSDPRLVLADEPTGNLDGATSDAIIDLLFARQRDTGATLVIITHDTALAQKCGRVIRMADGRIVSDEKAA